MDIFEPTIEYRPIPNFPGYHIGSDGSVWSSNQHPLWIHKPPRPWHQIATSTDHWGYTQVNLNNVETKRHLSKKVHILLLEIFVGPRPPGMYALHKNDVRTDNRLDNLYWGTRMDNVRDAILNARIRRGARHHAYKLSDDDVREIRRRMAAGESATLVARDFAISPSYARAIFTGKERRYVK